MQKVIVICGDCGKRELTKQIVRICSENGGAAVFDGDRIYRTQDNPYFIICSVNTLSDFYIPDSIIVLGKALIQIRQDIDLCSCICIIDAGNSDSVSLAAKLGASVIGCSMSGRDTLSVSSFNEDNTALVTLRRSIITNGGIIEPCEFTVSGRSEENVYPLLAAAAVLLAGSPKKEK